HKRTPTEDRSRNEEKRGRAEPGEMIQLRLPSADPAQREKLSIWLPGNSAEGAVQANRTADVQDNEEEPEENQQRRGSGDGYARPHGARQLFAHRGADTGHGAEGRSRRRREGVRRPCPAEVARTRRSCRLGARRRPTR